MPRIHALVVAGRARCRGFSLTELMVATTLLATLLAGGLTALARAQSAWREASSLQQLHERAQYVFATLEPELQMAGYFGGAAPAAVSADDIPEAATRCGPELVRRLDLAVQVADTWRLPCEARGGGAVAAAQVLMIRRVASRLATDPEPGRAQWLSIATAADDGQLYWQGDAPWTTQSVARGEELRELILRVYYVARQADGDASMPALRMKSLTSIAGVPAFIDTEVMNGVEDLQIELVPSPAAPRSVRVRLRVRADAAELRAGAAPRTLDVTRHFTLRNARG